MAFFVVAFVPHGGRETRRDETAEKEPGQSGGLLRTFGGSIGGRPGGREEKRKAESPSAARRDTVTLGSRC